jgi:hypothetical protein
MGWRGEPIAAGQVNDGFSPFDLYADRISKYHLLQICRATSDAVVPWRRSEAMSDDMG